MSGVQGAATVEEMGDIYINMHYYIIHITLQARVAVGVTCLNVLLGTHTRPYRYRCRRAKHGLTRCDVLMSS